jgi:hypothetical protein
MATSYAEKLKDPRWQQKRLQIMGRDGFTCLSCGDSDKELHVHHLAYRSGTDVWDYDNDELITLCKDCHKEITDIKKKIYKAVDAGCSFVERAEVMFDIVDKFGELNFPELLELCASIRGMVDEILLKQKETLLDKAKIIPFDYDWMD